MSVQLYTLKLNRFRLLKSAFSSLYENHLILILENKMKNALNKMYQACFLKKPLEQNLKKKKSI